MTNEKVSLCTADSNRVLDWNVPLYKQGVEDYSVIIVTDNENGKRMVEERDTAIPLNSSPKNDSPSPSNGKEGESEDTVKLCYNNGKCVFFYCKWSTKTSEVYKYFMKSRFETLTNELKSQYVLVRAKDCNRVLPLSQSIRDNGLENGDEVVRKGGMWASS